MGIETRIGSPVAIGDLLADPHFSQLAAAMRRVEHLGPLDPEPERQPAEDAAAENRERALAWHLDHTDRVYRDARADHPAVLAWVQRLLAGNESGRPSLMLLGTLGTGKTYQCYGALRLLAESGARPFNPLATTAAELYDALRPGNPGFDRAAELARYAKAPILLLDDLGSAKHSEFTEEVTYRIVNHRYANALPTLFTTNLLAGDIKVVLGDRVASRLAEMCENVAFKGQDRRRTR
jgi:DNA replication protein DnaC